MLTALTGIVITFLLLSFFVFPSQKIAYVDSARLLTGKSHHYKMILIADNGNIADADMDITDKLLKSSIKNIPFR